ncbi:MAG: hypothetical protein HQ567_04250 [Candidatus Nealsonbacteria bacterium]|nr:hypothetical protein [Candidatus Nealsonbacteria bacterium]
MKALEDELEANRPRLKVISELQRSIDATRKLIPELPTSQLAKRIELGMSEPEVMLLLGEDYSTFSPGKDATWDESKESVAVRFEDGQAVNIIACVRENERTEWALAKKTGLSEQIRLGMSEDEVVSVLGKPTNSQQNARCVCRESGCCRSEIVTVAFEDGCVCGVSAVWWEPSDRHSAGVGEVEFDLGKGVLNWAHYAGWKVEFGDDTNDVVPASLELIE